MPKTRLKIGVPRALERITHSRCESSLSNMEKDVSQLVYTDSTSLRAGCLPCPLHCCAPPSLSLPSSDHQPPARCTGPHDWTPESASSAPWSAAPTLTDSPPYCCSSVAPYCEGGAKEN